MKSFYRVMLGKKSLYAKIYLAGGFIGTDFLSEIQLKDKLSEDWRIFNRNFIPIYLEQNPDKTKVAAGLACGALWTVSKGILIGDIVLCPDGDGHYYVGEVISDYYHELDGILPHRRLVKWLDTTIDRLNMSEGLRNSTGSAGTVSNITKHDTEIENLITGRAAPILISTDETVVDPSGFALEKHLEDFLVHNWSNSGLGKDFDIYKEDGEQGQQFPTDTGFIDILAISKDKKTLLVIELKKGRASDAVVGQILRYMGFVKEQLADEKQIVRGAIIALTDDQRIRRALVMTPMIDFYRYEISFKLVKT